MLLARTQHGARLLRLQAAWFSSSATAGLDDADRIFTNLYGSHDPSLKGALSRGVWHNARALVLKGREWVVSEVRESGLRGRGGAGFLTGVKWGFMPKGGTRPSYLVVNGDESEPATCKDRQLMLHDPHRVIEGALLSAVGVGANTAYLYIRGEFRRQRLAVEAALAEAYSAGLVGDDACGSGYSFHMHVTHGAGAYICGEETALLESIEGKPGKPRLKPPYPAGEGLYGMPTTINNVETVSSVPEILRRGSAWYAGLGGPGGTGTKLFCVSGHVNAPCVVEEEMGIPMRELIERYAGGVRGGWDNLLAVFPGGSSCPMLPRDLAGTVRMDYDSLKQAGSSFGTGGVCVMDKTTDLVKAVRRLSYFYRHESCGQCTPCREGTGWLWDILTRVQAGEADASEIDLLWKVTKEMEGRTVCALGDAAVYPVQSLITHFRPLLEQRRRNTREQQRSAGGSGGGSGAQHTRRRPHHR